MMQKHDLIGQSVVVDGEPFYFPTDTEWMDLINGGLLQGYPLKYPDSVIHKLNLVQAESGLQIAIHRGPPLRGGWWYCVVVLIDGEIQRVHLEEIKCKHCSWSGLTANPCILDLYEGSDDSHTAIKRSARFPKLTCPKCNSELPRCPIWISPKSM